MKTIVFVFFCIGIVSGSYSQEKEFELRENQIRAIEKRNDFVARYADSLNAFVYKKGIELPDFFYNYNFDKENRIGWIGLHTPISLRKLIIDKVTNVNLLEGVLFSNDKRTKKRFKIPKRQYMGDIFIPFQEYSTYDLVKYRLEEIANENNAGKRASNFPSEN